MRNLLRKFYKENKATIEIASILLVGAGLLLNVESSNSVEGMALDQIRFVLMLAAEGLMIYLLWLALLAFLFPVLDHASKVEDETQKSKETLYGAMAILVVTGLLSIFFVFSLALYLLAAYLKESFFFAVTFLISFVYYRLILLVPAYTKKALTNAICVLVWALLTILCICLVLLAYIQIFEVCVHFTRVYTELFNWGTETTPRFCVLLNQGFGVTILE